MAKRSRKKKQDSELKKRLDAFNGNTNLFVWLCVVRCVPFLETFGYWPENERQKCVMHMLKAVDVIAFASFGNAQAIADYAANDAYTATVAFHGHHGDKTNYITMTVIAEATAYIAELGNRSICDFAENVAYSLHVDMESILLQDLDEIEAGTNNFDNNTEIYGKSWDDFQKALIDLNCEYWAEWYSALFEKGFLLDDKDETEINLRLNAPHSIIAQGAATLSQHMKTILYPLKIHSCNIFLSYCHADADLANIVDKFLYEQHSIRVTRDIRGVNYAESFEVFMQTIGKHDYVIMLISDRFLKSQACMYEAGELISTRNLEQKLLFIIINDDDIRFYSTQPVKPIGANIYSSIQRNEYISYWENRYSEEEKSLSQIKSDSAKIEPMKNLREIRKIIDHDISPFLSYLSDAKGMNFGEMMQANFKDILNKINSNAVEMNS